MEVKIGVQNVSRELSFDTLQEGDEVEAAVAKALKDGAPFVSLTDSKGRRVIVPADKLAYVEIGSPTAGQVGFRS
jgi:DNA-binding MurR/RpiR family transcriptional regulator